MDKLFYELSEHADDDLVNIYNYTEEQFGHVQAIEYLTNFDYMFESLCSNPKLGRTRNEIRKGLRSISNTSHVIFYRVLTDRIRIVRVLHASRDVNNFFPK